MIIRPYRREDMPFMLAGSASNAWDLVPEAERTPDAWQRASLSSQANLLQTLNQPTGAALVVEEAGQPVAFILLAAGPDGYTGQTFGYLADIYITPPFRRQGISMQLHQAAEQYFRSRGVTRGKLWIGGHNEAAIASAKRAGFEVEAYILSKEYQ